MDWTAIIIAAITSSGLGGFVGWRIKRKQGEIETVKKLVDEIYKPALEFQEEQIKKQNKRIDEQNEQIEKLQGELTELRAMVKDCADSRDECHRMLATLQDEISRLQRSRDQRGRYAKEPRIQKTEKDAATC